MNSRLSNLIQKYPELEGCLADIDKAYQRMLKSFHLGRKLLVCGNGGSAADAEHIVGELMKGYLKKRPVPDNLKEKFSQIYPAEAAYLSDHLQQALPAISLVSQVALSTAFTNDVAADMVFAQQVYGYGRPGDVLLGLSTSGNASNVLNAMKVAKVLGLHTLGLTGHSGGIMAALCDVVIRVPWDATPDIQERHLPIIHVLCAMLEESFFE
jgi:phosphoheptose isomerase